MVKTFVSKRGRFAICILAVLQACALCRLSFAADAIPVRAQGRDKLAYSQDDRGNQIPDFSHCGYAGADASVPTVPVRIVVKPETGDDGQRIQAAIDAVAKLPVRNDGFRGAVLLAPGQFEIRGQLKISDSGVVLRGSGAGNGGTTLVASGRDRRPILRIEGIANRVSRGKTRYHVLDDYVPVGTSKLRFESVAGLRVGDQVIVTRPSTLEWIKALD